MRIISIDDAPHAGTHLFGVRWQMEVINRKAHTRCASPFFFRGPEPQGMKEPSAHLLIDSSISLSYTLCQVQVAFGGQKKMHLKVPGTPNPSHRFMTLWSAARKNR